MAVEGGEVESRCPPLFESRGKRAGVSKKESSLHGEAWTGGFWGRKRKDQRLQEAGEGCPFPVYPHSYVLFCFLSGNDTAPPKQTRASSERKEGKFSFKQYILLNKL